MNKDSNHYSSYKEYIDTPDYDVDILNSDFKNGPYLGLWYIACLVIIGIISITIYKIY